MARLLGTGCRFLVTAGLVTLLFVGYQLWGTGLRTARAQQSLDADLTERLEAAEAAGATIRRPDARPTTATAGGADGPARGEASSPPVAEVPAELLPGPGEAAGRIVIPAIGLDWTFVEGVTAGDLVKGPGHYPETPWPGQPGNAALAGHRTTYGQPFHDLDRLRPGDEIVVTTLQGRFVYEVRETTTVTPDDVAVLGDGYWDLDRDPTTRDATLTLTACHPKYSASERIVVAASLLGAPAPPTARPGEDGSGPPRASELDVGLSAGRVPAWSAAGWGAATVALGGAVWWLARRHPASRWPTYALGALPVLVALFFFFEGFSALLPADY